MSDSVFQLNCQVGQEFCKYVSREKSMDNGVVRAQQELREKQNARKQLRRRSSLNVKGTDSARKAISRQQSFCQTTKQTQTSLQLQDKDIEFTIINLETQTIGMQCAISTLGQNYSNKVVTQLIKKKFAGQFMKIWRDIESLEKKYKLFFSELSSTHEYNSHHREIASWMDGLYQQLWEQRDEITRRHDAYNLKLKRKEQQQLCMLENYRRGFERGNKYECADRKYSYSPVQSEFGSEISSISSMSSVSSIGSQ